MTAVRDSYDIDVLAAAMVPMLKAQSRIVRTDEDDQVQEIIARSIGRIERQCDIAIAPQVWTWTPRASGALIAWNVNTEWVLSLVPVRGVASMTAKDSADVAFTDFTLRGINFEQGAFAELHVTRPNGIQVDDVFTIEAGWADPYDMPPELRDTVIRYAAALWENREAWATQNVGTVPEWVTEALGIFWVPKV